MVSREEQMPGSAYKKEEIMRNKAGTPENPAAFFKIYIQGSLRHKHTHKQWHTINTWIN